VIGWKLNVDKKDAKRNYVNHVEMGWESGTYMMTGLLITLYDMMWCSVSHC